MLVMLNPAKNYVEIDPRDLVTPPTVAGTSDMIVIMSARTGTDATAAEDTTCTVDGTFAATAATYNRDIGGGFGATGAIFYLIGNLAEGETPSFAFDGGGTQSYLFIKLFNAKPGQTVTTDGDGVTGSILTTASQELTPQGGCFVVGCGGAAEAAATFEFTGMTAYYRSTASDRSRIFGAIERSNGDRGVLTVGHDGVGAWEAVGMAFAQFKPKWMV